MMVKLSVISPDLGEACFLYRGHPWLQIGAETQCYSGKNGFNLWSAVMTADVVLMCRPFAPQHISIAKTIKDAGKRLILDFDDSYHNIPQYNPNAHHFKDCQSNLKTLCQLADVVTVSTQALADEKESYGAKSVVVIHNAIDDCWKKMSVPVKRNPIVIWRGAPGHAGDLDAGRAYLTEMNKTHEIIFFGAAPEYAYTLRHRHFGVSDYANFITTMNNLAPEILAVPLVDNAFNRAKSDIAAQEAFLIGAKLWHNGVGEYAQHKVGERGRVRWASEVNEKRKDILCSLQ